ncbi:ABC transporter permease (plasmid) [Shinella sumterensis]|nr:ABC transporter permease [Shinella sumterensis]
MLEYLRSSWDQRALVWRLARREIDSRFRGSLLGVLWAVIVPLVMLSVYSLVFGTVFQSRWPRPDDATMLHQVDFPMILFTGLIVFGIFSDPINRAPTLILENVSYVKKVVFSLEILPVVALINALFTALISSGVLLTVYLILYGIPPMTALLLPLAVAPLILITLGISYVLASLSVFLRDLRHLTAPLTTAVLFLSPVFYSINVLPEAWRWTLYLNPITLAVIYTRDLLFWGKLPSPMQWATYLLAALAVASVGSWWFSRTKKAFADVL